MSKQIYRVEVTHTVYVLAANHVEAERAGQYSARRDDNEPEVSASLIPPDAKLANDVLDSIPWSAERGYERTVREHLAAIAAENDRSGER